MGKMFGNLKSDGLEQSEDRVGGGFEAFSSDVYDATIKLAYAGESSGGAKNVTIVADIGGKELRETIYITNKQGENFYLDKQDKSKKHPLPGFTLVDDICLLASEIELAEQDTETKVVKIYNFQERKELPTEVEVLTALIDKPIKLAVLRVIEDKQKKGDDGKYHNTGETRTVNQIDKAMHVETKRTVNEYRHEIEDCEFHDAWIERNQGKDRNRSSGASGGAGSSGSGKPAATSQKKSLFAKS